MPTVEEIFGISMPSQPTQPQTVAVNTTPGAINWGTMVWHHGSAPIMTAPPPPDWAVHDDLEPMDEGLEYDDGLDHVPPPIPYNPFPNPYKGRNKLKSESDMSEKHYNKKLSQLIGFKNSAQTGEIGLEIECEGQNLFNTPFQYWTCHQDGSLRETAGHAPIEYVLKAPLKLKEIRDALQYLDTKLKEAGSKVVKSQRTSVHVHVNCQKMTLRELFCYICLYLIFEELLVEWSGPERAGNLFCLRAKDSEFYIGMLESVLKTASFKQWREDYRYSACNVASIPKFGSLEFRSMQGTVDTKLIYTWVSILVMLKEASQTYDNPVEIVDDFVNLGPLPFFKKIFKDDSMRQLFESSPGLSGKLWDGLRLMRDVAHSCEWNLPVKKNQENQEDDRPRYKKDDVVYINGIPCRINARTSGNYIVKDSVEDIPYTLIIPQGMVLYYVSSSSLNLSGAYLKLDLREGPVESVED